MKRFALTFDDGPGPSTPALLDVLAAFSVKATFFLLGRNLENVLWRPAALRAAREGHVIGNHTWSHLRPDRWREVGSDIERGEDAVRGLLVQSGGRRADEPVPFRLPYGIRLVEETLPSPAGSANAAQLDPRLAVVASLGLGHQHWTSDFEDWTMQAGEGEKLADRMAAHIEACPLDAVLDLHDSGTGSSFGYERPATVEGVRLLLEVARQRGWTTFTVPRRSAEPP